MRLFSAQSAFWLGLLFLLACDPEPAATPPSEGLPGEWEMVNSTGLITSISGDGVNSETTYVDVRMVEPTTYRVTFTEDPRRVSSRGATHLERTPRNGNERDTVVSGGSITGTVEWELTEDILTLRDEDGYAQDMDIHTLDETELTFSYDVTDSTFAPYLILRSQARQTFVRR